MEEVSATIFWLRHQESRLFGFRGRSKGEKPSPWTGTPGGRETPCMVLDAFEVGFRYFLVCPIRSRDGLRQSVTSPK
jgi:hypothetical protein